MLFKQNIFVYGALVMVAVATYYLFHTARRVEGPRRRRTPAGGRHAGDQCLSHPLHQRDVRRDDRRLWRSVVYARRGRPFRRKHDRRTWLHRTGGDDLRPVAPGRRTDGRTGIRLRRRASAKARAPADADPVRISRHGARRRHHHRGGRPDRPRAPTSSRRKARCQRVAILLSGCPDRGREGGMVPLWNHAE